MHGAWSAWRSLCRRVPLPPFALLVRRSSSCAARPAAARPPCAPDPAGAPCDTIRWIPWLPHCSPHPGSSCASASASDRAALHHALAHRRPALHAAATAASACSSSDHTIGCRYSRARHSATLQRMGQRTAGGGWTEHAALRRRRRAATQPSAAQDEQGATSPPSKLSDSRDADASARLKAAALD